MCGLQFPRMHVRPVHYQDQAWPGGCPISRVFARIGVFDVSSGGAFDLTSQDSNLPCSSVTDKTKH